ncbi:caspase family protein [Streptomyces sp. IB2014 016-6]|uniref:caspase, EACC1-associated type n=1 Tax=Streptomyces sp. IB2014 016-6 TaxID=2517818 RepID=UPI0011C86FE9|nr:caspase family protein [Streptomyces sp. IB2014 016-6]TXL86650.1 peptidase C14 caspase catalytic subunit p20 [Streptomyces sp. IB2014 016-6]
MTDLAGRDHSRSRAVLMGTWDYTDFGQVLAVERSFNRMRNLLLDPVCGPWPEESIVPFRNLPTLGTTHVQLIDALREATDVAFFYYVGHGIYDHRERLCLTVGDTRRDADYTAATGLLFEDVRDAFRTSRAAVKIAVLDCCYAGLATEEYGRLSADRLLPVSGAYLLMSSSAFETSWYEKEEVADAQTYFTKTFVETVHDGVRGAPAGLTLDHIFGVVADQLVEDGRPEPGRRIEDHAASWVFAHNNAPDSPPQSGADPDTVYREAYRREMKEGVERLPVIAALYRAAAEAGHTPSMNRLGQIAEGRVQARMQGIEPGPVDGGALMEATRWYSRASEAGDQVGPLHLGQLYEEQYKDQDQALYWYSLAARRGNGAAQERLTGLEQRVRLGLDESRQPGSDGDEGPESVRPPPATDITVAGLASAALRERWLADWGGSEELAFAQCLDVLIDACGGLYGEWAALDEAERRCVLLDFMAPLPRKADLARAAGRYYRDVGPGNLRAHAAELRRRPK